MKVIDDKQKLYIAKVEDKGNSQNEDLIKYKKDIFENELFKNEPFLKNTKTKQEEQDLSSIFSSLMPSSNITMDNSYITNESIDIDFSEIDDNIKNLVAKILINSSDLSNNKEVVILLTEKTFLEGVSISLRRLQDGVLNVQILCQNNTQYININESKDILLEYLKEYEKLEVQLDLAIS